MACIYRALLYLLVIKALYSHIPVSCMHVVHALTLCFIATATQTTRQGQYKTWSATFSPGWNALVLLAFYINITFNMNNDPFEYISIYISCINTNPHSGFRFSWRPTVETERTTQECCRPKGSIHIWAGSKRDRETAAYTNEQRAVRQRVPPAMLFFCWAVIRLRKLHTDFRAAGQPSSDCVRGRARCSCAEPNTKATRELNLYRRPTGVNAGSLSLQCTSS